MKNILTFFLVIVLSTPLFSQASRTFIKTFRIEPGMSISTELYGNVTIQEWGENYVRVQSTVSLKNFTPFTLENLLEVGRYNLESSVDGMNLSIFNKKTQFRIKIQGIDLLEEFNYIIFVPSSIGENSTQIIIPESLQYNNQVAKPTLIN